MKKIAIIGALVLAIGASMAAGTMAKYTQKLDDQTAVVTAKKFEPKFTVSEKAMDKIAPGETVGWEVTLDNSASEVDTEATIEVKLQTEGLSVESVDGKNVVTEGNSFKVNLGAGKTEKYTVNLNWEFGQDRDDQKLQGKDLELKANGNAVQVTFGN